MKVQFLQKLWLGKINIDDNLESIILAKNVAWCNEYKQRLAFKKEISKELMPVAWHPAGWWDWCMPEVEEKEIEPIFTDKSQYKVSNIVKVLNGAIT